MQQQQHIAVVASFLIFSLLMARFCRGDVNDSTCLQGLMKQISVLDWNSSDLANPCKQNLTGILCNGNNRIVSILLASKGLKGSIPAAITNCANLNTLDLSDNQLTGNIPSQIGQLSNLAKLNLSSNHLSGNIPDSLSNCTYLSVLDLHQNGLSGAIPFNLGSLQLRLNTFDVSENDLSGRIPYALANTPTGPRFNASSFKGNKHLHGFPLPEPKSHSLSVLAIVGIGLGSGMLSLIVSFTAVCIWLRLSEQRLAAEEGKISQLMPE